MEFNRNHYFLVGLVVLFLGLQLRLVDSFVLSEEATRLLAQQTGNDSAHTTAARFMPASAPALHKVIQPAEWIGWATTSVGVVLVLHSLAMRRPGG